MKNTLLKVWVKAQNLLELVKGDSGQDLIEYALLAALIAVVSIAAIGNVGNTINNVFSGINTDL